MDSGFAASRRPGMTSKARPVLRLIGDLQSPAGVWNATLKRFQPLIATIASVSRVNSASLQASFYA